jgi:selenocysteine-specific elongation factor
VTVVATAGHVDHGKSTLVLRLTGTDPDRWDEEKSRGLTIDLGFASMALPSGGELSFIDVPGHIRFIRNMLAGVGAVDACVFVVAATEGWKPQSEEHLRILSLLGIDRGLVVLTKIDQVDDDLYALAELDVEEHVDGTFLEGAPVLGVSATEGTGIDELRAALDELVAGLPPRDTQATPRLWVDRAFAPAGAGTVVTGTIVGGSLQPGDEVLVAPGGHHARVRSLQSHHRQTDRIDAGNRAAVNLTGVSHNDLGRGDVLVHEGAWHHTQIVDAELTVLESLDHPVSRRGAYVAYIGSAELPTRLRVLGTGEIAPGSSGAVRLYLASALPLLPGDRYVLRESGRDETVGGGQLLDVDPVLPASVASPDRSVERVVVERGWVRADQLLRLTGIHMEPNVDRWVVDPAALTATVDEVRQRIIDAGPLGLDVASLDDRERAVVGLIDDATVEAGRATLGEPVDPLADHPWVHELEADPFSPPGPDGVDRAEVRELVRRGAVIESDGVYFGAGAIEEAARMLAKLLADRPDGFTVADARDTLGTTRKYVLPLLAHLDRTGVTRRREDVRIGGPRLPTSE